MSHPLDNGKARMRSLVGNAAEAKPRLPLVHNTDSYTLRDILDTGMITPQSCNVFVGEMLTYFFYGRPSFRPKGDSEPTGLKHYFPVCLIFKSDWAANVRRAFPFDSGGFQNGFYAKYFHENTQLGDFGLEPDMTTPGKVVSLFFGSNPAYLIGKSGKTVDVDPAEFEAKGYQALVDAKDTNAIDSRGSGIEIQTAEIIPIVNAVSAVVCPSIFADGAIGTKLRELGIDTIPYRTYERSRPTEYMSEITSICFDYYIRLKIVKEGEI